MESQVHPYGQTRELRTNGVRKNLQGESMKIGIPTHSTPNTNIITNHRVPLVTWRLSSRKACLHLDVGYRILDVRLQLHSCRHALHEQMQRRQQHVSHVHCVITLMLASRPTLLYNDDSIVADTLTQHNHVNAVTLGAPTQQNRCEHAPESNVYTIGD